MFLSVCLNVSAFAVTEEEPNRGNVHLEFKGYAEKPVIDGYRDEYGYAKVNVAPGDLAYAWGDLNKESIGKNIKFDFYASYDADYLYIFVTYNADYYYCDLSKDMLQGTQDIWGQAFLGFNISESGRTGNDLYKFGIARNHITGELIYNDWVQKADAAGLAPLKGGEDFQIVRDGGNINYELRIPYKSFRPSGAVFKEGEQLRFSMTMGQAEADVSKNQNEGGYIYIITMVTGVFMTDNVDDCAFVTLGVPIAEPEITIEESVASGADAADTAPAAAAPTAVSPQTNDAAYFIFILAAFISLASAYIAVKKVKR